MHTPHLSSKPAIGFRRLGLFRFSMPEFLASLALLLVAAPFVEELAIGEAIESFLMTLVLVSGVMAVGKNKRILLFAGLLAVPAALTKWLSHAAPTGLQSPARCHALLRRARDPRRDGRQRRRPS